MTEITESRNIRIKDRIVTLPDVRRLANVVVTSCEQAKAGGKKANIRLSVTCIDDSQFDSKSVNLFSDESVIISKKVSKIELRHSSDAANQEIKISLHHGGSDYGNCVTVSGQDSNWVNGTLKKVEEIISGFKPQNQILTKYKHVMGFVFALSIGSVYFYLFELIPAVPIEGKPPEWAIKLDTALKGFEVLFLVLKYVFAYLCGIVPALFLIGKLEKLWPSIEIQIGPEHTFVEKQRRTWITGAFLLGVVPLLTSVVYDLLKVLARQASS